ncbi:Uncharacterised protein [Serratia ficaria]|nr:Uncharacterised protein [Serratia ficaria]
MDNPASELAQIILNCGADIVILSESNSAALLKKIINKVGGQWAGARAGSSAVLSSKPLGLLDKQLKAVNKITTGDVIDNGSDSPAYNGASGITVLVDIANSGTFDKKSLIVSSVHPEYRNYAAYLPRGYDGNTWKPLLDGAVTDIKKIQDANRKSGREAQLNQVLTAIEKYEAIYNAKKMTSVIAGDFNEPSGVDWSEGLKSCFGHHGVVYDWDTTRLLREKEYIDTFHHARLKKNGLTENSPRKDIDTCIIKHPGITWQSCPPKNKQGHWGDQADDRDRLDFIFIRPTDTTTADIQDSVIVGDNYYYGYYQGQTSGTSVCKLNDSSNGTIDDFLTLGYPKSDEQHFPSDHRGVLTTVDLSALIE